MRGDVTAISCDAWLVPTDAERHVEEHWRPGMAPHRTPFFVDVVNPSTRIANARRFITDAAHALAGKPPGNERAKHLVALPLIGTGGGGGREIAGQILSALLPALAEGARTEDVDVALVLRDADAFAAAQRLRASLARPFATLDDETLSRADALATLARAGKLVLFLGAGASRAAGLPLWREMLRNVAKDAGLDESTLDRLGRLGPLDQAQYLDRVLEDRGEKLLDSVVRQVAATEHSITHALLASLPVREVVTTNYDDLFERAWRARGAEHSVLPHAARTDTDRWILKLHGCVTAPAHIVLTREDYLSYLEQRGALSGIVQSLMLTRHMLFVGASLEDENFHRIVHEVRKVVRLGGDGTRTFGTVLDLAERPFVQQLWRELDWVAFAKERAADDAAELAAAARRLEVFLDRLVAGSSTSSEYLLSVGYHGVDEAEERLRERLLDLLRDTSLQTTEAWEEVDRLAKRLGYRAEASASPSPSPSPISVAARTTGALPQLPADPFEAAITAARWAGERLREEFHREGGPRGAGEKAEIDEIVERALRDAFHRAFPGDGFQGEETSPDAPDTRAFWCVDPNDGTRAFLKGDRGFSVSIGRIERGVPTLGVVYAPCFPDDDGDLIAFREGGPLLRNGAPIAPHVLPRDLGPHHVVSLARAAERAARAALACCAPARFRAVPSLAYRFALIAVGEADAGGAIHGCSAWDVAGAHALLRACGGDLFDDEGRPVRYAPYRRRGRIFAGTREVARTLASRRWDDVRAAKHDPPPGAYPFRAPALPVPGESIADARVLSRAQGALLGLLAGDNLGQRVEFLRPEVVAARHPEGIRDLVDGGTFSLMAGQPTDDGELALLLSRALDLDGAPREDTISTAYRRWVRDAFDVGNTIGAALDGRADPDSQANGSLMRIAPIGIFGHALEADEVARLAREESERTHPNPICGDACAIFCVAIAHAIRTGDDARTTFEATIEWARASGLNAVVLATVASAVAGPPTEFIRHAGWVRIALQNAFFRFLHHDSLQEALAATAAEGGDADTNCAIAGALLGAVHGRRALPAAWWKLLLSCRPIDEVAPTRHPRERVFWPVDALVLAERLLVRGRR